MMPRAVWDHPRACGEHYAPPEHVSFTQGSSPRLRGTPLEDFPELKKAGIIPALAGNTWCRTVMALTRWDHPRACGEHPIQPRTTSAPMGSSPRLRGTRFHGFIRGGQNRIIPALAGNTRCSRSARDGSRDHPRACGEHHDKCMCLTTCWGSSPRLRGTLRASRSRKSSSGIIPALAGTTCRLTSRPISLRDHPRACGEHICTLKSF